MKTASFLPSRIQSDFRQEIEGVLEDGETLSQFVEGAVRREVDKRKYQAEFVRRGIAAIRVTQRTGNGVLASEVLSRLDARLLAARQALAQRGR